MNKAKPKTPCRKAPLLVRKKGGTCSKKNCQTKNSGVTKWKKQNTETRMENFIFFNFNAVVRREKNISTANLSLRNFHSSRNQIKRKLAIVNERGNIICLRNMKLEKTRKWGVKLDELVKVQVNHEESKQSSPMFFHHT